MRKNYDPADRVAPGVYRIDWDRFALRAVVKVRGQRVVDETKEIRTTNPEVAIAERGRWLAELRTPYTPTEVVDADGRVLYRKPPDLLVVPLNLGAMRHPAHHNCDCIACLPPTY